MDDFKMKPPEDLKNPGTTTETRPEQEKIGEIQILSALQLQASQIGGKKE